MTRNIFRRLGAMGAGILGTEVVNHIVDYVIFPIAIARFGTLKGGLIMTLVILIENYANIRVYQMVGIDEIVKWLDEKRTGVAVKRWEKAVKFILNAGYWPTFLFLCWEEPTRAFIFVRGGKLGKRFTPTDWYWFFGVNLIGAMTWAVSWGAAISLFKYLWHLLS